MLRICSLLLPFASALSAAAQADQKLTVGTYNVDGLPDKVLFVNINTSGPGTAYTPAIADHLEHSGWDIIGMNEDFNYHELLTAGMPSYDFQTYQGKFEGDMSIVGGIMAGTWRFEIDGLELATRKDYSVVAEDMVPWCDEAVYGYLTNSQDGLTTKGFRYYCVHTAEGTQLDVIILHADAGFATGDRKAREAGQDQLLQYIEQNLTTPRPLIIMGDFNCLYQRDDMEQRFMHRLSSLDGVLHAGDAWVEFHNGGEYPVCQHPADGDDDPKWDDIGVDFTSTSEQLDKIVYVNRRGADAMLCLDDTHAIENWTRPDGIQLSDHLPVQASFTITFNGLLNGISSPWASAPGTYYDLSGRQLPVHSQKAGESRGITIEGGRKTIR